MDAWLDPSRDTLASADLVGRLHSAFDRTGYTETAVALRLGGAEIPLARHRDRDLSEHLWRTRGTTPLDTLVRLFLLGQVVPRGAAAESLAPLGVEEGVQEGLLTTTAAGIRATVRLEPVLDHHIASDWRDAPDAAVEPVMGVAASTRALAQMMIPRHVERALDLGAGSGVLALLAARHADHVWAVDLNPRAAALTRFNAALNGVANIDARVGDLFDPVCELTFDQIVCNPPFVIAPTAGRMHSQTGRPADEFCRSLVRSVTPYLRPGGFCQLVANWVHPADGDWQERLAGWFAGLGCDAWVLQARTEDTVTYARNRIGESTTDPAMAAARFDEWMSYYERAGIAGIGFGVITLRRSTDGVGWVRCDPLPPISGPCGQAIEDWFARQDFLRVHQQDSALLAARVRRADNLICDRRDSMTPAGWVAGPGRMRLTAGLMFTGAAPADVAAFVARCTGATPLADELPRFAAQAGRDPQAFAPAFLAVVRQLIEAGILTPADRN